MTKPIAFVLFLLFCMISLTSVRRVRPLFESNWASITVLIRVGLATFFQAQEPLLASCS